MTNPIEWWDKDDMYRKLLNFSYGTITCNEVLMQGIIEFMKAYVVKVGHI